MKEWMGDILASVLTGLVLPGMLLNGAAALRNREPAEAFQPLPVSAAGEAEMDGYLVGVLLAEMPAWFEPEALKAQAVVARTYARKAEQTGGKHGDGSVCHDPACCQGYTSEADYLQRGGTHEDVEKIRNAVLSTTGQVLTYEGELIEATYFSCSGGATEDAAAVWGADFPYLQSVESPGEEEAAYYRDQVVFTPEELADRLGLELTGDPEAWFGKATYTEGGGVDTILIGGQSFAGTEVRSLLGLRSAAFSVDVEEGCITITTRGFGHRVGMSQYGADAMAAAGSSYQEILAHYYQGTELSDEIQDTRYKIQDKGGSRWRQS